MSSRGTVCFRAVGGGVGGPPQDVMVHIMTNASICASELIRSDTMADEP
jgi:hypothetical protein